MEQDIFLRIASIEHDAEYKKLREPADNQALEKAVEESVMPREGEEPLDEDTKAATQKRTRHKLLTKAFNFVEAKDAKPKFREHGKPEGEGAPAYHPLPPNQWKESILTFAKYTVIKMPRVFQAVFYLLGYQREEICERDTNKLEWKKARLVLLGPTHDGAEFFKRLADFHPFGAKDGHFKLYQKLRFLKKLLRRHEQAPEQVEEYSIPLAKLFKWLLYSMELRVGDVLQRRELKNKLKEERRVAEEAFQERERVRHEALEHARTDHEAKEDERLAAADDGEGAADESKKKRREFDEKGFLRKWDSENLKIEVPPAVVDDVDIDYDLIGDEQ